MFEKFLKIIDILKIIPKLGIKEIISVLLYRIKIYTGIITKLNKDQNKKIIFQLFNINDNNIKIINENNSFLGFNHSFRHNVGENLMFPPLFSIKNGRTQGSPLHCGRNYDQSLFLYNTNFLKEASLLSHGYMKLFSNKYFYIGSPPDWFKNPFNNKKYKDYNTHFSKINEFNNNFGDIKTIWEISRFNFSILLSRAYLISGNRAFYNLLNKWSLDWFENNPPYSGPNWKCGQEASIRVIQVLITWYLTNNNKETTSELIEFIIIHCSRILMTIQYAIAQNNNHGTSEAAALYIAGVWLTIISKNKKHKKKAMLFLNKGKYWLENRVNQLIHDDGSFSQYSLNYHRLLIDTLNIVEFFRKYSKQEKFSILYYQKAGHAIKWLFEMINPETGTGPNLGANDGSRVYNLTSCDYLDMRPSIQTAYVLFFDQRAYQDGPWDEALYWLNIQIPKNKNLPMQKQYIIFPDGGYVRINWLTNLQKQIIAYLRFSNYNFRPCHADSLHLDLWFDNINILRDGGSFSYNTDNFFHRYFSGIESHNSIQFDNHDQMPILGRFLFGNWTKMKSIGKIICSNSKISWKASYIDYKKCFHQRSIIIEDKAIKIIDTIKAFKNNAVLRWRLFDSNWKIYENICKCNIFEIKILSNIKSVNFKLTQGYESLYYMEISKVPVLEIHIKGNNAVLMSIIKFN